MQRDYRFFALGFTRDCSAYSACEILLPLIDARVVHQVYRGVLPGIPGRGVCGVRDRVRGGGDCAAGGAGGQEGIEVDGGAAARGVFGFGAVDGGVRAAGAGGEDV